MDRHRGRYPILPTWRLRQEGSQQEWSGADGYHITAQVTKDDIPHIISCLKEDTLSWRREGGLYVDSEAYWNRRGEIYEEDQLGDFEGGGGAQEDDEDGIYDADEN